MLVVKVDSDNCVGTERTGLAFHFLQRHILGSSQFFLVGSRPTADQVGDSGKEVPKHICAHHRLSRYDSEILRDLSSFNAVSARNDHDICPFCPVRSVETGDIISSGLGPQLRHSGRLRTGAISEFRPAARTVRRSFPDLQYCNCRWQADGSDDTSYLNLETALGDSSIISQLTLSFSVMTTGRMLRFHTSFSAIAFTHTDRAAAEIRSGTVDPDRSLRVAKPCMAPENLHRTHRNLEFLGLDVEELEPVKE